MAIGANIMRHNPRKLNIFYNLPQFSGMNNKLFTIQDQAYSFPYHHLLDLTNDGVIHIHKSYTWGLEYLTYMLYIKEKVLSINPKTLLDVGCGDGRLIGMIAGEIPKVSGVDLSEKAISFARAFNPAATFHCGPVSQIQNNFELITCIETLEHIPDHEIPAFVSDLASRLTPEGNLIVSVPTTILPVNRKHYRHYHYDLLKDHLGAYFQIKQKVWLFKNGPLARNLNRMLNNRYFLLNHAGVKKLIWRTHYRLSFFASQENGCHLVAVCGKTSSNNGGVEGK